MIREFFASGTWRSVVFAWSGLVVVLAHSFFKAFIKYKLNNWYERFWDAGGAASEIGSGDTVGLQEQRDGITSLLVEFGLICLPGVIIHPLFKLFTNTWILTWRIRLVKSYLERWKLDDSKIENGAQRVHEDTQRFARGLQTFCVVILDSVMTLSVFAPILLSLGAEVKPSETTDAWLLLCCAFVAIAGVFGSVVLGWSLIGLEVENQRVEAELRKNLVILEEDPRSVCEPEKPVPGPSNENNQGEMQDVSLSEEPPLKMPTDKFRVIIRELRKNYMRLYRSFAIFSLWLNAYEQSVVIIPYAITAPLLFASDPSRRITLGKVSQLSNAFATVFSSLNILSDNWVDVTDWLSVLRRLREWEAHIGNTSPIATRSLITPTANAGSHVEMTSTRQ